MRSPQPPPASTTAASAFCRASSRTRYPPSAPKICEWKMTAITASASTDSHQPARDFDLTGRELLLVGILRFQMPDGFQALKQPLDFFFVVGVQQWVTRRSGRVRFFISSRLRRRMLTPILAIGN